MDESAIAGKKKKQMGNSEFERNEGRD